MASNAASSHNFQKLKLDSPLHKPGTSTFASIPRHDATHSAEHDQAQSQLINEVGDLSDGQYSDRQSSTPSYHRNNGYLESYNSESVSQGSQGSSSHTSSAAEDGVPTHVRHRTTSISFDSEVTLDNGSRLPLDVPVPKSLSRHAQTSEGNSYSDQDYLEMPIHARKPAYPRLQTAIPHRTARRPELIDPVASLTSDQTASPPLDELRTPLETPSEYMLSPIPATSPIEFPLFSPRRNGPTRSKSYRSEIGEDGSVRVVSRRSSNRSGRSLSSMSPAASFLARYKVETPIKPSEPDDEGQGIGYEGEYIIGKQIGYGGFSVVKEVTSIEDGRNVTYAVKIVRKQLREKSDLENEQIQTQFDHEVEIWRFLRHSYILPLLRVYTSDFATFCITRLVKGGTLFDLVRSTRRKKEAGLPKHLAQRYAYQVASALRYLHNDVQVVHRDVKLENCLIEMTAPNAESEGGDVLMCDFGMADFIVSDQRDSPEPQSINSNQNIGPAGTSTSVAGSLQYAAPELFDYTGPVFSPSADIWAYGVLLYALLTATLPFNDGLDIKTTAKIREGSFDEETIRNANAVQDSDVEDVLALVRGCLTIDAEDRWTIHDVLSCAWFRGCDERFQPTSRPWLNEP